ncbi:MAG: toxin HicA [Deltaproteobacteria bacterium]|nr:toxin HicA [Deltaproteobacteria bacterium]
MEKIKKILLKLKQNPNNISFSDLCKICDYYFGKARQTSGSHRIYKTAWQGDPRINIQNNKGKAKVYQVKQIINAIEKSETKNAF